MALLVNGVARVPKDDSVWGSVVRILSSAGTLTLDDTTVHFSSDVAPIFSEAGFAVTSNAGSRRRLLAGEWARRGAVLPRGDLPRLILVAALASGSRLTLSLTPLPPAPRSHSCLSYSYS